MSLWSSGIIIDLMANRPTDNNTLSKGRLFFPSDNVGASYIDTGSGWTQVGFPASGALTVDPIVLPAANGGSSYTLPQVIAHPTASLYYVRGQKWKYGSGADYTITTSGGVSTLNIINTTDAPQTGDVHELHAV